MEQNATNTALLVMDMQMGILGMLQDSAIVIANAAKAIAHARAKKMHIIYVTISFRPGLPEASTNNKSFANGGKERYANTDMNEFARIHADLAPQAGELTVIKRRISAFTGSDLEVILRSNNIQHIILAGISTSGVVLSTLREAADKDYSITVITDCCADRDEEVHRVLTTKIFARQADVLTVEEFTKM